MTTDNPDATQPNRGAAEGKAGQPPSVRLELDASGVQASYANVCAVTPMPLEVILDFVLMMGPPDRQRAPIKVNSRVVLNFFSAKQLMLALRRAVERYEAMYGVLELDPRKRLTPTAREMLMQQTGPGADDAAESTGTDNVGGDGSGGESAN